MIRLPFRDDSWLWGGLQEPFVGQPVDVFIGDRYQASYYVAKVDYDYVELGELYGWPYEVVD